MGILTEVVISNDALYMFQQDPKLFGETILEGINQANILNRQVSMPFKHYANHISIEPSRHADHEVLFIHGGNRLAVIGAYEADWKVLVKKYPKHAKTLIKKAKNIIKQCVQSIKE